jgi:hypothetical protein
MSELANHFYVIEAVEKERGNKTAFSNKKPKLGWLWKRS